MISGGWKWIEQAANSFWPASLELVFAGTLILVIAMATNLGLRRAAASVRHWVWALTMGGLLFLPLLCSVLPKLPVAFNIPVAATTSLSLTPERIGESAVAPRQQDAIFSEDISLAASQQAGDDSPYPSPAFHSEMGATLDDPGQATVSTMETPVGNHPNFLAASCFALLLLWTAGTGVCLVAMIRSLQAERCLAGSACAPDDSSWQELCDKIGFQLGIRWAVTIGVSLESAVPLTIGWRMPKILLPVDCIQWTAAKRRVVLVHELSHIARHDVFWQIVARLACSVYWFHPLAWLADRRMRVERELACDDAVLRSGSRPDQYATVLLDVAAAVCRRQRSGAAAIAMAGRNSVERRIRAILQPGLCRLPLSPRMGKLSLIGALALVILAAALHPFAPPQAKAEPAKPETVAATAAAEPKRVEEGQKEASSNSTESEKPDVRSMRIYVLNQDGKPVAGAKAKLWGVIRDSDTRFYPPAVHTDNDGAANIEFPGKPTSYVVVFVWADGYVTAGAHWESKEIEDPVPTEFTLTLEPGTTMGGFVRNEQGEPIADVEVAFSGQEDLLGGHRFNQADEKVRTNAEGRWTSHRIPKNLSRYNGLRIKLKHADYPSPPPFDSSTQPVTELRDGTAVMVMRKGTVVEGTVTDPQGQPIAGAAVGQFTDRMGSDFPHTETSTEGHYRLPACEPGEFTIVATAKDCAPVARRVSVGKEPQNVDLQLCKGEMIRIRVVDKEGKPMPRVTVATIFDGPNRESLFLDNQDAYDRNDRVFLTDAGGSWSRVWIPDDELTFVISKPGCTEVRKKCKPQQEEYVVTLEEGGWRLSGQVVDRDTKAPITKFHVVEGDSFPKVIWRKNTVVENFKGEYRAEWNTSGDSRRVVRIEADGYLPSKTRPLKPNERAATFNVELRKGEEIVGIVRGPDGKPVADADVALCSASRLLYLRNASLARDQNPLSVRTGSDGQFAFAPQGEPYILIVIHDLGYARVDDDATHDEILLQPWARVEGTLWVDGRPGVKEQVGISFDDEVIGRDERTWTPTDRAARYLYYDYKTETDDKGHFAFEHVRPGKAKISRHVQVSRDGSGSSYTYADHQAVEFVPGRALAVKLGAAP